MKILLVSATKFEVLPFAKMLSKKQGNLWTCKIGIHKVDVLITGVGMTATAFSLGKYLNRKYDLALNVGVAGSFNKKFPVGSLVNVVSDCFADLGAEDGNKFIAADKLGLGVSNFQTTTPMHFGKNKIKLLSGLPKVNGITVNMVHGNISSIKRIVKSFNPDVESMEGAAFFYACKESNIPSLQIRAISNMVEKRNKKKWNMNLAIKNLNNYLEHYLLSF